MRTAIGPHVNACPIKFEEALKAGKQSPWYDDALFHYAEWMNNYGWIRPLDHGQWQHPTLLKGFVSERVPLNDGETVRSGDRVEVVVTIEAKNNYEYLLFEDLKPGGLEAVRIRSGESLYVRELKSSGGFTGRARWVYQELRDRKVALFIDRLPEGVWQLSYEMRAEAPGTFHALPVLGHAMYVPEIRTNGAETRVRVVD